MHNDVEIIKRVNMTHCKSMSLVQKIEIDPIANLKKKRLRS